MPRRIRDVPVVVTCHDLLAVRGALGEATDTPASATGKRLQRWIVQGLEEADAHRLCFARYPGRRAAVDYRATTEIRRSN